MGRHKLPDFEIVAAYKEGLTTEEIVAKFRCSKPGVSLCLLRNGIDRSGNSVPKKSLPDDEIIAAYQAGKSKADLMEKYGCSESGLSLVLRRNGIYRRRRGGRSSKKSLSEIDRLVRINSCENAIVRVQQDYRNCTTIESGLKCRQIINELESEIYQLKHQETGNIISTHF